MLEFLVKYLIRVCSNSNWSDGRTHNTHGICYLWVSDFLRIFIDISCSKKWISREAKLLKRSGITSGRWKISNCSILCAAGVQYCATCHRSYFKHHKFQFQSSVRKILLASYFHFLIKSHCILSRSGLLRSWNPNYFSTRKVRFQPESFSAKTNLPKDENAKSLLAFQGSRQ